MTRDKELEDRISQFLVGKSIVKAEVTSYDGLIEIDGLTFTDGNCIRFGLPHGDGEHKNG